jgi:hypothetical protein
LSGRYYNNLWQGIATPKKLKSKLTKLLRI